jgi:sirohydrochlorin ferrochelatase
VAARLVYSDADDLLRELNRQEARYKIISVSPVEYNDGKVTRYIIVLQEEQDRTIKALDALDAIEDYINFLKN